MSGGFCQSWCAVLHLERPPLHEQRGPLHQRLDAEAGRRQRGDDLADAVVPLHGVVVLEGGLGIGVRTGFVGVVVPHPGPVVEVRVLHREIGLAQAPVGDGVELHEVQTTARDAAAGRRRAPTRRCRGASRAPRCPCSTRSNVRPRRRGRARRRRWPRRTRRRAPPPRPALGPPRWPAPTRSTPTTRAPSRAHDSVSMPKWHWRCDQVEALDVAGLVHLVATKRRPACQKARRRRRSRTPTWVATRSSHQRAVELEPALVHAPSLPPYAQRPPHPREGRSAVAAGEDWAGGNSPRCCAP